MTRDPRCYNAIRRHLSNLVQPLGAVFETNPNRADVKELNELLIERTRFGLSVSMILVTNCSMTPILPVRKEALDNKLGLFVSSQLSSLFCVFPGVRGWKSRQTLLQCTSTGWFRMSRSICKASTIFPCVRYRTTKLTFSSGISTNGSLFPGTPF